VTQGSQGSPPMCSQATVCAWDVSCCAVWHSYCQTVVETQVSMGAYRPYCKTLYWTCCSMAIFFRIFPFLHFCASCIFCATMRLPRIHHIPFACPVLILQGPLVRISLCFIHITSYMSLHSHLCSLISLCVYITSPLYV